MKCANRVIGLTILPLTGGSRERSGNGVFESIEKKKYGREIIIFFLLEVDAKINQMLP